MALHAARSVSCCDGARLNQPIDAIDWFPRENNTGCIGTRKSLCPRKSFKMPLEINEEGRRTTAKIKTEPRKNKLSYSTPAPHSKPNYRQVHWSLVAYKEYNSVLKVLTTRTSRIQALVVQIESALKHTSRETVIRNFRELFVAVFFILTNLILYFDSIAYTDSSICTSIDVGSWAIYENGSSSNVLR